MQVFVRSLSQDADSDVVAFYEDHITPGNQPGANESHPGTSILRGVESKYIDMHSWPPKLKKEWRESMPDIVSSEAAYRIEEVFPTAMQSSASLKIQTNTMSYGADVNQWPASEQAAMKEIKRGMDYITSVNAARDVIINKNVANPSDDANWPAPIDPIKL